MLKLILSFFAGPLTSALSKAYEAKLAAESTEQARVAEAVIADITRQIEENRNRTSLLKEGMQHRAFWIPWLIAAVPTSAWFGWGMLDSLFDGVLPDVAALPPQLKAYADVVFANIFYTGAGMAGFQAIASAIRRK